MKQIEVSIMGQSYLLGCPEGGEQQLRQAVTHVDREMCAIRDAGKLKARERIAVLAALNLAFELAGHAASAAQSAAQSSQAGTQPSSAQPANGAAAGQDGPAHAAVGNLDRAYLDSLIARLDATLNDDGHLL